MRYHKIFNPFGDKIPDDIEDIRHNLIEMEVIQLRSDLAKLRELLGDTENDLRYIEALATKGEPCRMVNIAHHLNNLLSRIQSELKE